MVELLFVNKPHNNHYYEWGRNCATLGYDEEKARKAALTYGLMSPEDSDMFWEGYNEGPRPSGEIYSIDLIVSNF